MIDPANPNMDDFAKAAGLPPTVGWSDDRLRQAYLLIDDALLEHSNPDSDANAYLSEALNAVENADVAIEKGR